MGVWRTSRVWKIERKETQVKNWKSGWGVDGLSMKVSRETFIHIPIWGEGTKQDEKKCTDTLHEKIALHSQTRGMHTSSAEYTTFITFELINRKSGARPLKSLSLENGGRRENKKKKAAHSNDELTCPRERKRVNKVQ